MQNMTELLGILAGMLTTFANLPQLVKVFRSKSVKDLSAATYAANSFGTLLWLLYGIQLESISLILANIISCVLTTLILAIKLRGSFSHAHS